MLTPIESEEPEYIGKYYYYEAEKAVNSGPRNAA